MWEFTLCMSFRWMSAFRGTKLTCCSGICEVTGRPWEVVVTCTAWYANRWKYLCHDNRGSIFSERSANCYQSTWHHIPEDSDFSCVTFSPTEDWVQFRASPCGIYGGQSVTETGFFFITLVFLCVWHSIGARYVPFIRPPLVLHNLGSWQHRLLCFLIVILIVEHLCMVS
jgi:hypothetical protein